MENKFVSISILAIYALSLCVHPVNASELEDISTPETIGTQLVTPEGSAMPYMVTGESLVSVISHMVDFDINGSTLVFNRPTGQIVVKNTPDNISQVENILAEMRNAINRQVHLEARIITVASDEIDAFGLEAALGETSLDMRSHNKGSVDVSHGIVFPDVENRDRTSYYGQEFIFGVVGQDFSIGVAIDALKSMGEVNTLSAPQLTVFNNQRAHVKVSTIEDYVSEIDADIEASSDNLFYTVNTKVRRAPAGTILDVTPTINNDGTITLSLHPTFVTADLDNTVDIDSVSSSADGGSSLANNTLTLPVFTTQALDTTVVIPDGGVIVIGGMIGEAEVLQEHYAPMMTWIPVIGNLFKNKNNRIIKAHLVIFVKATSIVASNNT